MAIRIICNELINNIMIMTIVIADFETCSVIIATCSTIEFLLDALSFASMYVGIMSVDSHAIRMQLRITCAHVVIAYMHMNFEPVYESKHCSAGAGLRADTLARCHHNHWMNLFFFSCNLYDLWTEKNSNIKSAAKVCALIYYIQGNQ